MMPLLTILLILMPWLAMFQLTALATATTPSTSRRSANILAAALALPLAMGISSLTFFLWLALRGRPGETYFISENLYFSVLGLLLYRFRRWANKSDQTADLSTLAVEQTSPRTWRDGLISGGFFLCAILGAGSVFFYVQSKPHGGWDAYAIWNYGARMLYRGGEHWTNIFSATTLSDYPLLLQSSIARLWTVLGNDTVWVPRGVCIASIVSLTAILAAAVGRLRDSRQGYLAGATLLATYHVLEYGTDQYADVVLSGFFLSAVVLFVWANEATSAAKKSSIFAAGLAAGLAAWTKNEGLVFVGCLCLVAGWHWFRKKDIEQRWRQVGSFAAGLLPVLAAVFFHKYYFHTQSLYTKPQALQTAVKQIFEPGRYWQIAQAFGHYGLWLGYGLPVVVGLYVILTGLARERLVTAAVRVPALICVLMAGAYFSIYVLTPLELTYHLRHSLSRLLLQLWPTFLFCVFMATRTAEPRPSDE